MAKSKNKSLKGTKAAPTSGSVKTLGGLPEYAPFVIVKVNNGDKPLKVWFEKNTNSTKEAQAEGVSIYRGSKSKSWLVGDMNATTHSMREMLARSFTDYFLQKNVSVSTLDTAYRELEDFMNLCEDAEITQFSDLDASKLMILLAKMKRCESALPVLRIVGEAYQLPFLINVKSPKDSTKRTKDITPEALFEEKDYPDDVLMQLTGYTIYHLNSMFEKQKMLKNAQDMLNNIDESPLAKIGVLLNKKDAESYTAPETGTALDNLFAIYSSNPDQAVDLLLQNLLVSCANEIADNKQAHILAYHSFSQVVLTMIKIKNKAFWQGFRDTFMQKYAMESSLHQVYYSRYIYQEHNHNLAAIFVYLMLQTGCNKEVIQSLKRSYNGLHWRKRFDVKLGVDAQTVLKRQVVRITGYKSKGGGKKKAVDLRVPVDSYMYKVLVLAEELFSSSDENVFFPKRLNNDGIAQFCSLYEISEEGVRLTSIDTTRIRKCYAGAELIKAINESEDGHDLTRKLRDALDHESFDTTLFSYLMKTGVGNYAMSSAIAALTTKMVEDALEFKGQIITSEKKPANDALIPVFLCDCEDPTKPTHDVPIATRCTQYDLCLGCERSQVHAEHIIRICYRIYQYDQAPSPVSDVLADRKAIALDLIERFKQEHPEGELIVTSAYEQASEAILNNTPLLPPIL